MEIEREWRWAVPHSLAACLGCAPLRRGRVASDACCASLHAACKWLWPIWHLVAPTGVLLEGYGCSISDVYVVPGWCGMGVV